MDATDEKKDSSTARSSKAVALPPSQKLDYRDLKPVWDRLIDKKRVDGESGLLRITTRIGKIDPIAEQALIEVKKAFFTDESSLRQLISSHGWATSLDRVNKRLNALRISENKRLVLAKVYPALLAHLLQCDEADEAVRDEIGFANDILFALERKDGPLDQFAQKIVKMVGSKHRINFTEDNVMLDLIAHQVRARL